MALKSNGNAGESNGKKKGVNKTILIIIGIVLVVALIGVLAFLGMNKYNTMKDNYEIENASLQGQIEAYQQQLAEIGTIGTTYQLKADVKGGAQIDAEDFEEVNIPVKYTYDEVERPHGYVTDLSTITNQRYKTDLSAGTIMTPALVYPDYLTSDLRLVEVSVDKLPLGLEAGEYVDFRITFAGGQDMIYLKHKEIISVINYNTVQVLLSEMDQQTLRSVEADKALYVGVETYAVRYIDGGVQESSKIFYPIRTDALATIVNDPNIADDYDISEYSWYDRDLLESQLISMVKASTNEYANQIGEWLEEGRAKSTEYYQEAQKSYIEAQTADQTGTSSSSMPTGDFTDASQVYNN